MLNNLKNQINSKDILCPVSMLLNFIENDLLGSLEINYILYGIEVVKMIKVKDISILNKVLLKLINLLEIHHTNPTIVVIYFNLE